MPYKLGILLTHPVQYYSPWFIHLADIFDLEVFYACRQSPKGQSEAGFGVEFEWDINLLEGYKYRWLENVSKNPGTNSFFGCDTPGLYKIIQKEKFDAFMIIGWNYKSALQAVIACKKNGIPVFMRGDSHLKSNRSLLKKTVKYLPYRILLPRVNHLYVGKLNREYLVHYGVPDKKLFFVPHCVDNDYFYNKSRQCIRMGKNLELRNKFNIPEEAVTILFVGKLIDKKRPYDLIEAYGSIVKKHPGINIHILIVGDGPLKSKMEERSRNINDKIHFAGFINQSELPCYYSASDLIILPSEGETWGLVVNEAMSCGLPAMVSDRVGCAPDLIDSKKTGFIFEKGNTDSLKNSILDFYHTIQKNESMYKENIRQKISEFSITKSSHNLLNAIETVSNDNP